MNEIKLNKRFELLVDHEGFTLLKNNHPNNIYFGDYYLRLGTNNQWYWLDSGGAQLRKVRFVRERDVLDAAAAVERIGK